MDRASKRAAPREILGVLYNRSGSFLYGCILFFKYHPGGQTAKPHNRSAVFTVAEILGPDDVVVHGSVDYLIQDIRRLLRSVYEQINANNAALSHLTPTPRGLTPESAVSTLGEMLDLGTVDTKELYAAMEWLVERQLAIQQCLAKHHLQEHTLMLYDLTSSYVEATPLRTRPARPQPRTQEGHAPDRLRRALHGDLGIAPGNAVALQVFAWNRQADDQARVNFFRETLQGIRALLRASAAGAISALPLGLADITVETPFTIHDRPPQPGEAPSTSISQVTPGYFEAMRIPSAPAGGSTNATTPSDRAWP